LLKVIPWRRKTSIKTVSNRSLPTLHGPFDIIFIDADKRDYIEYYDMIMERKLLASDGIIVANNVLSHGCTVDSNVTTPQDPAVQDGAELRKFNDHIKQVTILPAV
jgi:predicted O-methyltransferase YrrM